ncbi:hypothetical protein [Agrobacterium vitis]|uniref:hypothetical protein n=1 Tax=Agrobacterium vitis TaxID=373 RepID=UPI0012E802BD|nr:hypothetical protein [Agrobacterium vitis]MUZ63520.1 hypothetical protein [Agrobacterium vitis]
MAYREIEAAEALLKEVTEALDNREAPDIRDAFGRPQRGLQLGVPSGDKSQRLFNIPWSVCRPVLELHIANHRAELAVLTEKAKAEIVTLAGSEGGA